MTNLPMTRSTRAMLKPANRQAQATQSRWRQFVAAICNPDLIVVVLFCLLGLLISANVILHVPEFGAMAAQLQVFP